MRHIIRFLVAAFVLWIVSFLVPGFEVAGYGTALLAAIVITGLGWLIETFMGREVSPYARGIVGFLVSAVVIYVTQFIVAGVKASILGALLAALVIGIVDLFMPTKARFATGDETQS